MRFALLLPGLVAFPLLAGCSDDSATTGTGGGGSTSSSTSSASTSSTGSTSSAGSTSSSSTGSTSSSSSTGGGTTAAPECATDMDCKLVDDCCRCEAMPNAEDPPMCMQTCIQTSCSALGLPKSAVTSCVAGRCVAGFECDWSKVICAQAPPSCPPGQTAAVTNGCFGSCVPAGECRTVGGCAQCTGGLACVVEQAQLSSTHCVDVPPPCSKADCACFGPSVCTGSFDLCNEGTGEIDCSCPTC